MVSEQDLPLEVLLGQRRAERPLPPPPREQSCGSLSRGVQGENGCPSASWERATALLKQSKEDKGGLQKLKPTEPAERHGGLA